MPAIGEIKKKHSKFFMLFPSFVMLPSIFNHFCDFYASHPSVIKTFYASQILRPITYFWTVP